MPKLLMELDFKWNSISSHMRLAVVVANIFTQWISSFGLDEKIGSYYWLPQPLPLAIPGLGFPPPPPFFLREGKSIIKIHISCEILTLNSWVSAASKKRHDLTISKHNFHQLDRLKKKQSKRMREETTFNQATLQKKIACSSTKSVHHLIFWQDLKVLEIE